MGAPDALAKFLSLNGQLFLLTPESGGPQEIVGNQPSNQHPGVSGLPDELKLLQSEVVSLREECDKLIDKVNGIKTNLYLRIFDRYIYELESRVGAQPMAYCAELVSRIPTSRAPGMNTRVGKHVPGG